MIGINDYKYVDKLHGAVADADAIANFLKTSLGVADDRIRNIRDEEATGSNIRDSIRFLASCDDIQEGDPILIYYAGHGAEADPPEGWPSDADKIQMLLPYDFCPDISTPEHEQGILDITLSILLSQLAKAKGDNIVSSNRQASSSEMRLTTIA